MSKVAYHEAGHAVVGVLIGRKITRVWLEKDPREVDFQLFPLLGACELDPPADQDHIAALLANNPDALEKYIMVLLAGFAAEAMFRYGLEVDLKGRVFPGEVLRARDISDRLFSQERTQRRVKLARVRQISAQRNSMELQGSSLYFQSLLDNTTNLLRKPAHWQAVKALARALRKRGSIPGREVHRIVAKARRGKESETVRVEDSSTKG
jgi:hypothetical protein